MSSTLTSVELAPSPLPLAPSKDGSFDIVEMLLSQQQDLSAVEQFSRVHESLDSEPAQARYYQELMPATAPGPNQQLSFEVDLDACSGCKACVVACHTLNGLEESESWRRVGTLTIGEPSVPLAAENAEISPVIAGVQHVTTACHHCEDPGCLNGCPVKAYDKDPTTGIVRHLDDQCIGCKYCTMMCPYEVPKYSKRLGIVRKCDMCHQRLSVGEAPACVQSCPNEAIAIRVVDVASQIPVAEDSAPGSGSCLVPGAPLSSITRPTTHYLSSRVAQIDAAVPQDNELDEVAENHWPLAAMLITTQISVGVILLERMAATALWVVGSEMPLRATVYTASLSLMICLVGMNLAPLHLGQPLRAWRVFLGLRTSWLSREAVVLGKYTGALCAAVAIFWLPTIAQWTPDFVIDQIPSWVVIPTWAGKAALGTSILLGVAGLYCSAMIYIATKRKLWRHERTLPRFLGTSLVAGGSFSALAIAVGGGPPSVVLLLSLLAITSLVGKLAWEHRIQLGPSLPRDDREDIRCRRLVDRELGMLRALRWTGALLGVGFLLLGSLAVVAGGPVAVCIGLLLASLLLTVGESSERLLYFMSVVYDRMPGTLR